ncbi:MAG TPA: GNAT family acetyltransferase, partial [Clostridia bacterium]|nr:GNAT family acetyltransferase [Clostridia bacterium]
RGTGLFERVFYASLASMRERYPIMATFVNQINHRSYAAHTRKVPLMTLGNFQYNQNNYYLMACSTALTQEML